MAIKLYLFFVISFLCNGNLADIFHFNVQDPVDPFVGRQDFLQILHEILTRKVVESNVQLSSVTVVTGRGGIGKTETTRKYIQTYSDAFENVIWIEAENELAAENSFRSLAKSKIIADQLQIISESETKSKSRARESEFGKIVQEEHDDILNPKNHSKITDKLIQKIYHVLGRGQNRTLMIFDNVAKIPWRFFPNDLNENSYKIYDAENYIIPPSILLLGKKRQSSKVKGQQQMDSVKWLPLAPFTDDDNINYILHYPNLRLTSDDMPEVKVIENARLLGQLLGGIPLALKQAMDFISIGFKKHPEKGLEKYVKNLHKELKERNAADLLTSEPESATLNPIFLTWKITREKLSHELQGSLAMLVMDSLPYFPSSKISIRLLFYICTRDESLNKEGAALIKGTINTLHRYTIVNMDGVQSDPKVDLDLDLVHGTLSMHRELQRDVLEAFRELEPNLKGTGEKVTSSKFYKMAIFLLVKVEPFLDQIQEENNPLALKELHSIAAILVRVELALAAAEPPDFEMLEKSALCQFKLALWVYKIQMGVEGEESCRKLLTSALKELKRIDSESESKTEQILSIQSPEFNIKITEMMRKVLPLPAEGVTDDKENLVHRDLTLKALKFQDILLTVASEILGESHSFRLLCLEEEADVLWSIESPPYYRQNAVVLYDLLHKLKEKKLGKNHPDFIMTWLDLADKFYLLGNLQHSFNLFNEILKTVRDTFDPGNPLLTIAAQKMAPLLAKMGKHEEALELSKSYLYLQQQQMKNLENERENSKSDEDVKDLNSRISAGQNLEKANLQNMANHYVSLNQPLEAYKILENLYNTDMKDYGPADLRTVRHESEMARVLYLLKEYEKATKMQLHVHQLRVNLLGPNHKSTMDTKFDLADLYYAQHNHAKALEFYTLVYDFRKKTLGEEHVTTLATLEKLSNVHRDLNHNDLFHQMKTQLYATKKKLFGEEALETLNALRALSVSTLSIGQNSPTAMKEALEMRKKLYRAKKQKLGSTHEETLDALFLLSYLRAEMGDYEKAMHQLEAAHDFLVNNPGHGSESPLAALTIHAMGQVRKMQGKHGLALKLELQALETNKKALGPDHLNTLRTLEHIASMYYYQENYDEALKYYKEAHSIMTKVYGPENPKTLETLEFIGGIYMKQKQFGTAYQTFNRVFDIRAENLGALHPSTHSVLLNMGWIGNELGRHEDAIFSFKMVVEGRTALLGPTHESTLKVMENLAMSYSKNENYEEALKIVNEVYEGRVATLGKDNSETVLALKNIAAVYYKMGKFNEAYKLYRQVYEQKVKTLGRDHPETKKVLEILNSIESKLSLRKTEL